MQLIQYLTGVAILADIIIASAIGGVAKIAQVIGACLITRYVTRGSQGVALHAQIRFARGEARQGAIACCRQAIVTLVTIADLI